MATEKETCEEIRERLGCELEAEITKNVRLKLEKEMQEKLLEEKEWIRKKLLEEFEKNFVAIERHSRALIEQEKVFEARLLEQRELHEEYKKDSEAKLIQMQKLYEEKLRELSNVIPPKSPFDVLEPMIFAEVAVSEAEPILKSNPADEVQDEVPPILRAELRNFLRDVVEELDPSSFLKFTRSSRTFHSMARDGILKTDIALSCTIYEESEDMDDIEGSLQLALTPYFNKRPLSFKEINFLHDALFFRSTMDNIILLDRTGRGSLLNAEERLVELLDYIRVRDIDYLRVDAAVRMKYLLRKYNINRLRVAAGISTTFLTSRLVEKVQDICVDAYGTPKKTVDQFLTKTRIPNIYLNSNASKSVVFVLVREWLNGERDFKSIEVGVIRKFKKELVTELERSGISIRRLPENLYGMSKRAFVELAEPIVASVYVGKDGVLIMVRENLEMLRIESPSNGSVQLTYLDHDEDNYMDYIDSEEDDDGDEGDEA